MLKIRIISVGKTKEAWLETGLDEYVKRLKPTAAIEFTWVKNDEQLLQIIEKEPLTICLDPSGKLMTSEQFSTFLQTKIEEGGSRVAFVIGGAEGLPSQLKKHSTLFSLSPLTMTHQLTRLVLMEQIYRALEIAKGSPYHK